MNEIVTLLLAWRMAIQHGESESKAIYLCASKLWKDVEDPQVKHLFIQLAEKRTTETQRIKAVQHLESGLKKEKLL